MKTLLIVLLASLAAYQWGFIDAHSTVSRECQKLGTFYVGKKVFKCHLESDADNPVKNDVITKPN